MVNCDKVVIVGVDMNILEKFSSLVSSNNNINKDSVKKILDKYKYSVPLSLDDITKMDSEDIKELLKIYDSKNCDSLYEALSLNMTVLKMYKSNPNNLFFKEKHDPQSRQQELSRLHPDQQYRGGELHS